jgi:hypothetical protein
LSLSTEVDVENLFCNGGEGGAEKRLDDDDKEQHTQQLTSQLIAKPTPQSTPQPTPQPTPRPRCESTGTHDWEEMVKPGYSGIKGRVCGGATCSSIPFMDGKRLKDVRGYWPSAKNIVYHCKECDVFLCTPCKVEKDLHSPKKNKRRRHHE